MRRITATINLLFVLALSIMTFDGNRNFLYPRTCVVIDVDYESDVVAIETASGLVYEFYGTEDYDTGDLVAVLFFGGLTEKVTDDVILMHRYSGWAERFEEICEEVY